MGLPSFRRYDVQARTSLALALIALVPWLGAAGASFMRYNHQLRAIQFGQTSIFKPAFLGCIAVAGFLSVLAVVLGFNSAGQRRNKEERFSWMGFFIGMGVLTITILLFVAFRKFAFEIVPTGT